MTIPFVDLRAQYLTIKEEIDNAVVNSLNGAMFIGGEAVLNFERQFAKYSGVDHCVSCANGTDALEIALEVLGVGPGDEVLVPVNTWISTASAVVRVGAKPIFVEIESLTYSMDPSKIADKINSKTKAIIPVHLHGLPANMPEIMKVAKAHNLYVIEDCAQAHGASINDKKIGTFGHLATFSFYPSKNLGAYGDGGAVLTDDAELANRMRILTNLGQLKRHNHLSIGRNSRLDTMQAAILSVKLNYMNKWIEARRNLANLYRKELSGSEVIMQTEPKGYRHVYHLFCIESERREDLQKFLMERGVRTQLHYPKLLNQMDIFEDRSEFSIAEKVVSNKLSLPMYAELEEKDVLKVCQYIKEFYK